MDDKKSSVVVRDARICSWRNKTTTFITLLTVHLYFFLCKTDVENKVKEEYQKDNQIDHREWYQEDDDSHLKNQVKPNILQPEFKKKMEEARK